MSLDPFHSIRSSSAPSKAQLKLVLAATTEIIHDVRKKNNSSPAAKLISPTEYLGALVTALYSKDVSSHVSQVVTLLSIILPHVPKSVLRTSFDIQNTICNTIVSLISSSTKNSESTNNILSGASMRHAIEVLGYMLQVLSTSSSNDKSVDMLCTKVYQFCLMLSLDSRPKVRKTVNPILANVLSYGPSLKTVASTFLQESFKSESNKRLHTLNVCKVMLPMLPPRDITKIITSHLLIVANNSSNDSITTLVTLQVLCSLVSVPDVTLEQSCMERILKYYESAADGSSTSGEDTSGPITIHRIDLVKTTVLNLYKAYNSTVFIAPVFMSLVSVVTSTAATIGDNVKEIAASAIVSILSETNGTTNDVQTSLYSLLALRNKNSWPVIFKSLLNPLVKTMTASEMLFNVIKTVYELTTSITNMPSGGAPWMKKLFVSFIGTCIETYGPSVVMEAIKVNAIYPLWMTELLKTHSKVSTKNATLSVFASHILASATNFDNRTKWLLFPSFCLNNDDTVLTSELAKEVASVLSSNDAKLVSAVCTGLCSLLDTSSSSSSSSIKSSHAKKLLMIIKSLLLTNSKMSMEDENLLVKLVSQLLPLVYSDNNGSSTNLDTEFKSLVESFLQSTTSNDKNTKEGEVLLHLVSAYVSGLSTYILSTHLSLLIRVIQPYLLNDTMVGCQKRSYEILSIILKNSKDNDEVLSSLINDTVLSTSLLTCSLQAKKLRLECLSTLVNSSSTSIDIPSVVGEMILCTKDSNKKAREGAFDVLISIGKKCYNADSLSQYFQMVVAGLAGTTPHMRSATVACLARLSYEFMLTEEYKSVVLSLIPSMLELVIILLNEKAREVIKATMGFLKLVIAILPNEELEPFVRGIITGISKWSQESQMRFKAHVRIIMSKLCRKYSYETVVNIIEEEEVGADFKALISHIKKDEAKKKKESNAESKKEDTSSSSRIKREADGEVMDFLDADSALQHTMETDGSSDDDDDEEEIKCNKEGRMIIPDDLKESDEGVNNSELSAAQVEEELRKIGLASGKKEEASKGKKRGRDRGEDNAFSGRSYKAKKAGGDVSVKGAKFEPFAYVTLDPKQMAKRNKRQAVQKYSKILVKKGRGNTNASKKGRKGNYQRR